MLVEAIRRRNPFAHRLAKRDWSILASDQRVDDLIYGIGEIDQIDRITDLDRHHMDKQEEFGRVCERLAGFRDQLIAAIKASIR